MGNDKPKVAFIDDSETVRVVLRRLLEQDGCEPFECTCWEELERAARDEPLDLVLLDVQMPEVSGAPMAVVLKRLQPELPVVYHSDHDERFLAELTRQTGADGYVKKSLDADQTLRAIRAFLSSR